MHRILFIIAIAFSMAGCVYAPSIPSGYSGPQAVIKDSVMVYSPRKADFFYLSKVDGQEVLNSRLRTNRANQGQGMYMTPVVVENAIPAAKTIKLSIEGRTEYAAPVLVLTGTVYQIKGTIEFIPEPGKTYLVKGVLGKEYSAVWIEDQQSNTIINKKIEINGSAELGFFEK